MSINAKKASEKRYLVLREVRELYGIGYTVVQRLVRDRQLHRRKVGTAWRYPVADLEAVFSADTRISHQRRFSR